MNPDRIRIVLVQPSLGGNIGAAARAMKTMGLTRLYLVAPEDFPSPDATARAAGADDVLERACVFAGLDEAIADCHLVMGTSARDRRIPWPLLMPDIAAQRIAEESNDREVALVFGRERTGLTNDELNRCQILVNIPSNPAFSSLNLASAVQVLAYEIRRAGEDRKSPEESGVGLPLGEPYATHGEVQQYYAHLEKTLVATGFLDPANPRYLMRRLMRLYNRVSLTSNEVNILRGILTSFSDALLRRKN